MLFQIKQCAVLLVLIFQVAQFVHSRDESHAAALIKRLLENEDKEIRPNLYQGPVDVKCDFYVQSIGALNEATMDFELEIYFRQRWVDPRMAFTDQEEPLALPSRYIKELWVPDLYFPNEKTAKFHHVTVPNLNVEIYPDGMIKYSSRFTLKLSCPMDLSNYPQDYQQCYLQIESYSHTTDHLLLEWLDDNPVEIDLEHLSMPQFTLLSTSTNYSCLSEYKTGNFACLKAMFFFKRNIGYYMLQVYIPSFLVVIIAWVSFWINKNSAPARVALGSITVLTITTQGAALASAMKTSYPKAIDYWYAACSVLVCGALIEYALVNVLARRDTEWKEDDDGNMWKKTIGPNKIYKGLKSSDVVGEMAIAMDDHKPACCAGWKGQSKKLANRIDKGARILYPILFVVFNIFYWIWFTGPPSRPPMI